MAIGEFAYSPSLDAAFLALKGGDDTWRFYAGPAADPVGGQVKIYREDVNLICVGARVSVDDVYRDGLEDVDSGPRP